MDGIEHKFIEVNGLKLHVAEIGTGSPAVVFLHGFPEIWYTWRHQMVAVAKAGFRAIAPDYRGYGLSDPPPEPEKASFSDFIADLLALLDVLAISKVFLVGKDFGAMVAYPFALLHPDRVSGVVTLGVPFMPPGPPKHHKSLPEGFYISRWREPGRAEADFGRLDAKTVVRNIYILFSRSEIPTASEDKEIMDLVEPSTPLPSWFTEEDLATYGALYEKSGFRTALKVPYRSFGEQSDGKDSDDVPQPKVEAPALFIMGEKDYVFKFPGMDEYIRTGQVKMFVPNLEIIILPDGTHFVQEQFPDQVFLIAKDFGALVAYQFALVHPEKVSGVATLGVPFLPPGPPVQYGKLPEGFYMSRWQEPGRAEADFGRLDVKTVVRNIYILFSRSEIPIANEDKEIMDLVEPSTPLPSWFTEEDLSTYAALYEKSGFRTALQVPYRSLGEQSDGKDSDDVPQPKVEAPALFIIGEKDYFFKFPGMDEYIRTGQVKMFVPNLEIIILPDGTHFVQEQFPDQFFLVGKDFGAWPVFLLARLHPERITGVATLGVPYSPPRPNMYHSTLPEGFYVNRWQEPGRAEADFGRLDAKTVVRNIYILFSGSELPIAGENQEIMDLVEPATPLPPWFTEEDLSTYGALYEKSGFRTALKVPYRSMNSLDEGFDIPNPNVEVPALLIMGEKDYVLKFPGMEDYVRTGQVNFFVPSLETAYVPEGTHFVQEQFPEQVNGLKLHVAETGSGSSVVVFLHGFPEIWYSWRHQMVAVAEAGFRAVAPDYRGYGLSDSPAEPEKTTYAEFISDLLAVFDALSISKFFLVGKDFGVWPVFLLARLHPERVTGVVTLGVPYSPPSPNMYDTTLPEGLYVNRWQKPGRAEADFGRLDAKTVVRNIYILFSGSELPIAGENQEIMDLVEPATPLPPWFTEEDLETYGALYEKSGFRTALKVPYRSLNSLHEGFDIPNPNVEVPALLIMGEKDYVMKFPGIEDYVRSGQVNFFVPSLETAYVPEGTHFVQEQFPEQVNQLILAFLRKHS
ncbi:hypothetical protein RJ640_030139 [Escallonia rubra]|uniref:AB hydrolase-1 domain-containing protein n=1 Tax=Escallonia rubra TaxID=112253 RepID=A0AA88RDZ9_9ASTE|nr:hypothetical protein RJ640_030139 [Escallonia rubra]